MSNYKIIVPTGYMGSGSSAITGLLSEFNNIDTRNADFEYIFLHCPDGVFDLEDKLLIGNNTIRSDEAIHSFLAMMNELFRKDGHWINDYKHKLSPDFYNYCLDYIKNLGIYELKNSYWYYQQIPTSLRMKILLLIRRVIGKVTCGRISFDRPVLYDGLSIAFPDSDTFYNESKKFLYKVFKSLGCDYQNIVLDQLLLPHNVHRINNYFDENIRIIIVDRDPRDVFILNKYVWDKSHVAVPYPLDASLFCKYYKQMRTSEKIIKDSRVKRLHFEDLVYSYSSTVSEICSYLDLNKEAHNRPKTEFNPLISINNTQLFNGIFNTDQMRKETELIENNLKEYIYDFPQINIERKNLRGLF